MQIVAGLNLSGKRPKVWDPDSPYYLADLKAVMISYAEFNGRPIRRPKAMKLGLRGYLDIPDHISVYLDNGAFYFLKRGGEIPRTEYEEFVREAGPDWYPIPQDYIPSPKMSDAEQLDCLRKTMAVNQDYNYDGFVPVIHVSRHLDQYLQQLQADELSWAKPIVALGGMVPNLLRMPKAMTYSDILDKVRLVRAELGDKEIHVFGIGGTATLHIAALLGIDSVDSAGWRNRAARGIIQLPGTGERIVASLGNWRGRKPDETEWEILAACPCPACQLNGVDGLKTNGIDGFCNRATHNLWILLDEARQIEEHLADGTYDTWYSQHVKNSTYRPLIDHVLQQR